MKALRITWAVLFVVPILILSPIYAFLIAWILRIFGNEKAAKNHLRRCGSFIGSSIIFFLGVKLHVTGWENLPDPQDGICYMGNHQSMLDIAAFVGPAKLWGSIMAKIEVKKIPIINLWCTAMQIIYIDRKSPHDSIKAIFAGVEHLKNGGNLLIFPEGTRSKDGKLLEMKQGSIKLATRSRATIVPFAIKNLRPGFEGITNLKRVHAHMVIGKPIETKHLDKEELGSVHEVVYGAISELYDQLP
ncbi:MAG: lysophospholipid acyltransferase family protein [Sphaerochaeta sp.]